MRLGRLVFMLMGMAFVVGLTVWGAIEVWVDHLAMGDVHETTPPPQVPAADNGDVVKNDGGAVTRPEEGDAATPPPTGTQVDHDTGGQDGGVGADLVDGAQGDVGGGTYTPDDEAIRTPDEAGNDLARPNEPDQTPPPPAVVDRTHVLDTRLGMAMGETLSVLSQTELERHLDDLASLGVGWIRVDLAWSTVQPHSKERYRWDAFDRVVREARARDIEVLALITYTPQWARADTCRSTKKCEPADPQAFAQFAAEAVQRYGPMGVDTYEIWNEPNMQLFWAAGASGSRYTALLKAAYTAIKQVDPNAMVISGGLAPVATQGGNVSAREFVEQMYEHGVQGYFDALGYHPYSYPLAPHYYKASSPWSQIEETEWSVRGIMRENGDGTVPIWLTEYGAPTGGPGSVAESSEHDFPVPDHVTEAYQRHILADAIQENAQISHTGPLFWYSYKDLGTSQHDKELHFGILRADGTKKPAYEYLESR